MRILVVTPACHFSNFGAVQQDIYATIELLQEMGHTVSLYTLDQEGQSETVLEKIRQKYQIDIRRFRPVVEWGTWLWAALRQWSLFDRSAFPFALLAQDPDFLEYVRKEKPDVFFSYCSYSWPIIEIARSSEARCVVRSHNFEPFHFWEELTLRGKMNPLNWARFIAKHWSEKQTVKQAAVVAAISPDEEQLYRRWSGSKVILLPLVSLPSIIKLRPIAEKLPLDLFYLGATYNVPFHTRGAALLIQSIAPAVCARAPGQFRFHICGSKLPAYLQAQCDGKQIIYEGYVPDLDSFFSTMDGGVFPVWSGRGMKQKIFEALCRSFPIVVPKVSIGGYQLENGKNAFLVDKPEEMVESILQFESVAVRRTLSFGAYQFAEKNFNKKQIELTLNAIMYGNR